MDFEPILLEAPLRAVLDLFALALGTAVKRYKLLLELLLVPLHETTPLILFRRLLQRAHFIFALANVDNCIVRRFWNLLSRRSPSTRIEVILQMRSSSIRVE